MFLIHQPQEIIHEKYCITGVLGKGGVAITYSAVNLETNSSALKDTASRHEVSPLGHIAIKVISLKQLNDWKQIELFEREAEVLQKLNHPAIPQYIDYFDIETDTDKAFYLVQQIAPGKSLAQLVESGWRVGEAEVKNIAKQILSILSYLHSLEPPVIHRDIKPSNLIREDDGKIYLVDFGAVQNTYYNTLMQGSTVVGTYGYMAPEQFRGQALPATDLYSLGATLLYLLTHRSPAELPQDTLKLDFSSAVDISDSFADWLDKILEPNLEDRFSTAEVALAELFKSKQKKRRKLVTTVSAIALVLGLIAGFNSYKWFFLSRLGFLPADICSHEVWRRFSRQGGIINSIHGKNNYSMVSCMFINSVNSKNLNFTKYLIEIGADVNAKSERGYTPLNIAVFNQDIDTAKLLIKHGADVNINSSSNSNNLDYSIFRKNTELAKLLLENDADITNEKIATTIHPLVPAVASENFEIVKLLIEYGIDVNAKDSRGKTAIFAIQSKKMAQLLINNGANINIRETGSGRTILFNFIRRGNLDLVELLIENGADINIKNKSDSTPLFSAISKKREDIIRLLIESGVNVNLQGERGYTPLAMAALWENLEVIELLIKNGADVNAQDNSGDTALFYARNKAVAKSLIEHGADVNAENYFGPTSFTVAIVRRNKEIVQLLIDNNADRKYLEYKNIEEIHDSLSTETLQKIKLFLENHNF